MGSDNSNWTIDDEGRLLIRTGYGGFTVEKLSDGDYRIHQGFYSGGSGSRTETAAQVAKSLSGQVDLQNPEEPMLELLAKLNWEDVSEGFKNERLAAKKLHEEECFLKLERQVADMEPIWQKYKDNDYDDWRRYISDELEESQGYDPEDVSVRRLHYQAINWISKMRDFPDQKRLYMEMKQERQQD
jgi:hypothetical protein